MYEKILLPTDGSDVSMAAVKTAFKHAELYNAEIHIVYVIPHSESTTAIEPHMGLASVENGLEDYGKEVVDKAETVGEDYEVSSTTEIRMGVPYQNIVSAGEEVNADLIIIGTHGHSGAKRMLLGSTTERVIRSTELPVLTVQTEESD